MRPTLLLLLLVGCTSPRPTPPPAGDSAPATVPTVAAAPPASPTPRSTWPPLPTTGFIRGRAATNADITAGNAVFSAVVGGQIIGIPSDLVIPQYGIELNGWNGTPRRVIVVQAEGVQGREMLGYRYIDDGKPGLGPSVGIQLLGTHPDSGSN